ncbi:TniQ family protein, partial [Pseudomonas aeruginosa]|nr:TniQ family protein [Pseudomonas aeruginosa]
MGPHPFEGELFSSWLCRLAWGNGTKLLPFVTHHLLLPPQFLNCDIDRTVADSVVIRVGAGCGVAKFSALATKLSVFDGVLWEQLLQKGPCDWVLMHIRGARNPRQRAGYSLQFCRRCLAEDVEPHFRCIWGTVAKLAMRQPFVLFKGLTFQKLCLPGAFRPGDHHN